MRNSNFKPLERILCAVASIVFLNGCSKDPKPDVYKIDSDSVTVTSHFTNGLEGPCGWYKLRVEKPNGKITTYEDSMPNNYPLDSLTYTDKDGKEVTLRAISNLSPEERGIFEYGEKEFERYDKIIREIEKKKESKKYISGLEEAKKSL